MEKFYTTYYWIVVTWQRDQSVTGHVGPLSLSAMCLVKVKIKYFWFVTWPLDWFVTWLCVWGPFILSHHRAKFGIHRPWKSGDMSLIFHVTTWLMCHVTCGWAFLILSHHPASFGVHRPCESGHVAPLVFHVTTWSVCHVTLWVRSSHPTLVNLGSIGFL